MKTATELLQQLLAEGWQIHLMQENSLAYTASHAKRIEQAQMSTAYLCEQLAYWDNYPTYAHNWDKLPEHEKQRVHQIMAATVEQQLIGQLTSCSPDNPYLFDAKGNPICAVPDWQSGQDFVQMAAQKWDMTVQCLNRFESPVPNQFKAFTRLQHWLSKPYRLKTAILLYRLFELFPFCRWRFGRIQP